jgi:predicted nucleic acid-binding protein
MNGLLDTNILTRSIQLGHPMQRTAADAITALSTRGDQVCLVPQVLYEFWVVCTRPTAQNGLGMTAVEAEGKLANYKRLFRIFDDTPAILPEWERLVTLHQVLGKTAHDARLVAAMGVHGLAGILTFNDQEFRRFPAIAVLAPRDVLAGPTSVP